MRQHLRLGERQALLDCVFCQLGDTVNFELAHNIEAVDLNGLGADVQTLCDLLGRPAFAQKLKDLALSFRQDRKGGIFFAP